MLNMASCFHAFYTYTVHITHTHTIWLGLTRTQLILSSGHFLTTISKELSSLIEHHVQRQSKGIFLNPHYVQYFV